MTLAEHWEITWEDPPNYALGDRSPWPERLLVFRDRPGEWGRVPGDWHTGIAGQMRRLQQDRIIDIGYEFASSTKNVRRGRARLYVRWNGA